LKRPTKKKEDEELFIPGTDLERNKEVIVAGKGGLMKDITQVHLKKGGEAHGKGKILLNKNKRCGRSPGGKTIHPKNQKVKRGGGNKGEGVRRGLDWERRPSNGRQKPSVN